MRYVAGPLLCLALLTSPLVGQQPWPGYPAAQSGAWDQSLASAGQVYPGAECRSSCGAAHGAAPCAGCQGRLRPGGWKELHCDELRCRACQLPQHFPFRAPYQGAYYFRPYQFNEIPPQQAIYRTWTGNDHNPYDNRFLQAVYDEVMQVNPGAPIARDEDEVEAAPQRETASTAEPSRVSVAAHVAPAAPAGDDFVEEFTRADGRIRRPLHGVRLARSHKAALDPRQSHGDFAQSSGLDETAHK